MTERMRSQEASITFAKPGGFSYFELTKSLNFLRFPKNHSKLPSTYLILLANFK